MARPLLESLLNDSFAGVGSFAAFESVAVGSLLAHESLAAEFFADAGSLEWQLNGSLLGELTGVDEFEADVDVGVSFAV